MSAFFVTGTIGIGKSTLLRRVIEACVPDRELYGFRTEKLSQTGDPGGLGKVFIYPATGQAFRDVAHCVAKFLPDGSLVPHTEVFETVGVSLLCDIPDGAVVLMDELGFLESKAPKFLAKVLEALDRDCLILGAIKPLAIPFLDDVRAHPSTTLLKITELNRDNATEELIRAVGGKLPLKRPALGDV